MKNNDLRAYKRYFKSVYVRIKQHRVSCFIVGMTKVFHILAHIIPKLAPIGVARIPKLAPGMG